jgi:hypothetical protein
MNMRPLIPNFTKLETTTGKYQHIAVAIFSNIPAFSQPKDGSSGETSRE